MLEKSLILMMLLIMAALLASTGSATYKSQFAIAQGQVRELGQQLQKSQLAGQLQQQPQIASSQALTDAQLVNRILPLIIKNMDKKVLLQQLLPLIDIRVSLTERRGTISTITGGGPNQGAAALISGCPPGEVAISGGFTNRASSDMSVNHFKRNMATNSWEMSTGPIDDETIRSY
jgi:hypothetical protein